MKFLFFGRNSKEEARGSSGDPGKRPSQTELCEVCKRRPRQVEKDGSVHPTCGRTCARAHQPPCKHPPCETPGKLIFGGYCTYEHAEEAVRQGRAPQCADCGKQPPWIADLCFGCNSSVGKLSEPRLKELNLQDSTVAALIDNFNHLWKGSELVTIGRIYGIRLPPHLAKIREAYHSKLASAGKPRQIRTFHGRLCICDLGTNGTEFCSWSSCGICAIIRSAFDTFEFEIKSNSGRFGPGIYSYLEPSLADQWAVTTTSSPYRVMLVCEVDLLPPLVKPPETSGILQSHEEGLLVAVSGAEVITPKYLILYSKQ